MTESVFFPPPPSTLFRLLRFSSYFITRPYLKQKKRKCEIKYEEEAPQSQSKYNSQPCTNYKYIRYNLFLPSLLSVGSPQALHDWYRGERRVTHWCPHTHGSERTAHPEEKAPRSV